MVRDALCAILRDAGTPCSNEDHFRDEDWPDVEVYFPPCPSLPLPHVITDVSVVCPTARSYLPRAHNPLACAKSMQETKIDRYRHLTVDEAGVSVATSLPLVFESYGGLAPKAITLLGQVVRAYAQLHNAPMSPVKFSQRLRQRLSIALQRGNALIAKLGLGMSWRRPRRFKRPDRAQRQDAPPIRAAGPAGDSDLLDIRGALQFLGDLNG